MLIWNLYFIIKIVLHFAGVLVINPWLNLLLFALLLITNPALYQHRRIIGLLRYAVFAVPALALLLQELGLVVSWALVDQIRALFGFSLDYLWELFKRSVPPWMLWTGLAALLLVRAMDRYFRISAWVAASLLGLGGWQVAQVHLLAQPTELKVEVAEPLAQARENLSPAELLALGQVDFKKLQVARDKANPAALRDQQSGEVGPGGVLQGFFERQSKLVMQPFSPPAQPDFDILVLQICSMSWADMQYAKMTQHPALRSADFMFEQFNSATSYSGPAAIRLLRGRCGQTPHDDLYKSPQDSCLLFEQLRATGFEVQMGLNHDGRFQDFSNQVRSNLGAQAIQRLSHEEVPVGVEAFDGSQIGRDGDYLRAWWNKRLDSQADAVAFYYNSITLHDGNRLPNSKQNSLQTYPIRLERLLNDLQSLLSEIRRSNRKALVLVVPEHGAGLSGEYGQLVGLRELPTPAITRVPVFGYWVAPGYVNTRTEPVTVKQSVSYLALSELISRWLALTPEQQLQPALPLLMADLPRTRFVAQQGNITVMESQGFFWLKAPGTEWKKLGPVENAQP
ncbi:cellulose biosynthesis protein BcsG [Limnobacter sp.]|uniref:cellulose biosynthesis protein BcsG n=1 Tax=Limnobacter sp. TaxID=2003368 RepID=UPI003518F4E1